MADQFDALATTDTKGLIGQIVNQGRSADAQAQASTVELSASRDREAAARQAQVAAQAPVRAQLKDRLAGGGPQAPESQPAPHAPAAPAIDDKTMGDTLSLISGLAALGGLLTRHPLTTALNSFSQGVQGYVKGNNEAYQQSLKQFEASLKEANATNAEQWKKYQAARDKYGTDIQGLTVELQQIAAETQNPIDMELAKQGRIVDLMKLADTRNSKYEQVLTNVLKIREGEKARAEASADRRAIAAQASTDRRYSADLAHQDRQAAAAAKGAGGGSAAGNTRNKLVQAAAGNAMDRLNELKATGDGQFPTTSVMFGQHGTGVVSRATHSIGQSMVSTEQQKVDAGYASLIDEAIPVFTGGLRGSDAFRQFLLGQVPQPGDDPETANEKMRLFEANINGTLNTFGGVAKMPGMTEGGAAPAGAKAAAAPDGGSGLSTDEEAELQHLRGKYGRK